METGLLAARVHGDGRIGKLMMFFATCTVTLGTSGRAPIRSPRS